MIKRLLVFLTVFASFAVALPVSSAFADPIRNATESAEAGGCRIIVSGVTVKQVQRKVGVSDDGVLGPITCNAIKAYQCTKNLSVDGVVGPNTWGIMQGNAAPAGTRICADLKNQKMWLTKNGVRTYTAVRMRSGNPDLGSSNITKTGNFTIYWKDIDHISSIFGTPMPYSMFFYGGQAIHESSFSTTGSHGCINVTNADAKKFWNNSPVGTPISIWGVRPRGQF
ncbi:MAG TPA: L,D-transpeptidase family protein [Acidimicrobiia bacterium]|nr:L,D-transpeptidase family protein [Acidimicrobiia bacterium]